MKNADFLKMSVLEGVLCLKRHHLLYPESSIEELVHFLKHNDYNTYNFDYMTALKLIEIIEMDSVVASEERQSDLRNLIFVVATKLNLFWARTSIYGRDKVRSFLPEDHEQCLRFAGLLDKELKQEGADWWKKLGLHFRAKKEERLSALGMEGERLSLTFEKKRLNHLGISEIPIWYSINDEGAGFDIISYDLLPSGILEQIKIEVKATTLETMHIYLTRNEWDIARLHPETYRFHIWNLSNNDLYILNPSDVQPHIPINHGAGEWSLLEILLIKLPIVMYRCFDLL